MTGAWICSILPTFLCLLATGVLIRPGFGVTRFGAGRDPNGNLAALGFSHQRLPYDSARSSCWPSSSLASCSTCWAQDAPAEGGRTGLARLRRGR